MKYSIWISLFAAMTLLGCGDDRPSTRTDGGGGIVLMDGGTSGRDGGGGGGTDGGGGTCPPLTLDPPSMPACAASTLTCLMGCAMGDGMCIQACFEADPSSDACLSCLDQDIISCATMNGCADETGNVECCGQASCAGAADVASCLMSMCSAELSAWNTCIEGTLGTSCGITNTCFMTM